MKFLVDGPMSEIAVSPKPAAPSPPEWWEVSDEADSVGDVKAMLRQNLEELEKRRSKAPSGWKRAL